ncbi:MAG: hypothetical protein ACRCXB_22860 [Aeromonadaceae bacterium]
MKALIELLTKTETPYRVERVDLWGELELMGGGGMPEDWPPKPKPGEQVLATGHDEEGKPFVCFIPD